MKEFYALVGNLSQPTITVCEMKYSSHKYILDKASAKDLHNKIDVFQESTKTTKQIFLALITTLGVKKGLWNQDLVSHEVTLKDLFKPN